MLMAGVGKGCEAQEKKHIGQYTTGTAKESLVEGKDGKLNPIKTKNPVKTENQG